VSSEECEYIVTTLEPRFARILPTRGAARDLYSVFVVRVTYRENSVLTRFPSTRRLAV